MNTTQRVRRTAIRTVARLAGLAALLATGLLTAPAAFATRMPPPGNTGPAPAPPPVHTVVVGGTPGWQIVLLAVGAAVVAAVGAVLADRALRARRSSPQLGRSPAS